MAFLALNGTIILYSFWFDYGILFYHFEAIVVILDLLVYIFG